MSQETTLCLGEQVCQQRGWAFDAVFRHQFRISRTPVVSAKSWKKRALGTFFIEHCPQLPATQIQNRRGQLIGWCLGIAVDASGTAYGHEGGGHLTVTATFDAVERRHSQLAGRFALIVQIGDQLRYYPDASSGLTAVAHDELGVVASTVTLAINDEVQPSGGRSLHRVQHKPTLYLMDETPDARVRQLRANHYVDLATFTSHRFWPKEDTAFHPPDPPGESVERISNRLQTVMGALVKHFSCTLPVTGGRDSRLLAAAVPSDAIKSVDAFYVHEINWTSGFDVRSASMVAEHLKIPLRIQRMLEGASDTELKDLDLETTRAQIALATGYAHPSLKDPVLQSMHVEPETRLLLRGGAAELAQANKYPFPGRLPDHITPEFAFQRLAGHAMPDLLKLYGETTIERYWQKYKKWFSELPENARERAVDVGHMELWLSSGMGAVFYAPRRQFYLNPFSDQMLMHETMRFEPKVRKNGRLVKAILDRYSPGLAKVPYARQLISEARAA